MRLRLSTVGRVRRRAVIVAAGRSVVAVPRTGALAHHRPDDLCAAVVGAVLDRCPEVERAEVDDVLVGCGTPSGIQGYNMARTVALLAGLERAPGMRVSRYCASGLDAVRLAQLAVEAGQGEVFVCAAAESLSQLVRDNPAGRDEIAVLVTPRDVRSLFAHPGLCARASGSPYLAMGHAAENLAAARSIGRRDQDAYALLSYTRAEQAWDGGLFKPETVLVPGPDGAPVGHDQVRPGVDAPGLAALDPAFGPRGTVTAGNCGAVADGAAALLVTSEAFARARRLNVLGTLLGGAVVAGDPRLKGAETTEA